MGTNLRGTTAVAFNGVATTAFTVVSATQLTVVLPANVTSGTVTVTTPSGVSNSISFGGLPLAVTSLQPTRNAAAAPRATAVSVAFNQALSSSAATLSGLRVFSQQTGSLKANSVSVTGNTLTVTPPTPWHPGETVYATVSKRVQSADSTSLGAPQVFQFTTATAPATGLYNIGSRVRVAAGPSSPVLGDVDGDGDLDLLVASSSSMVSVRQNAGDGTYASSQEVALDGVARQLILGDVDGDSDLDLVAMLQSGSVRLLRNQGNGTFTNTRFPDTDSGQGIALGDVDADGDLDLVLTKPTLGLVNVFTNDGLGTFTGFSTSGIVKGINPVPVLADTDGDGDLDLLVTDYANQQARIYINIGASFFGIQATSVGGGSFVDALVVGDIDNDGDLDLLTANYMSSRVSVRRNNAGEFSGTEEIDLQARGPLTLALGDVDGDGDLDLLTTNQNTLTIGVRLNDGTGAFSGSQEVTLNQQVPTGLALGDVDGDGDLDLVTSHTANNTVSVLLNQNQLRTPENPTGTVAGLDYQYYEGVFTRLPTFNALPVLRSGTTSYFDLASVQPRDINYAVRFTGYVQVPTSGQYSFSTYSDDGSQLFIGSMLVANNDGRHNNVQERSGTIGLLAGTHALTLTYFQSGGDANLTVYYQGPDGVRRLLPATSLVRVPALASNLAQESSLGESAEASTSVLQLYPNPNEGRFVVHYVASQVQAATLVVSDRLGRQVRQQALTLQAGANEVAVDLVGQAQGLYQVLLRPTHDQPQAQKLVLAP
jgi:hypothetical protein